MRPFPHDGVDGRMSGRFPTHPYKPRGIQAIWHCERGLYL